MSILLSVILLIVVVGIYYYRYRDSFLEIASTTDNERGNVFWTLVAIVFSIVVVILYIAFRQHA